VVLRVEKAVRPLRRRAIYHALRGVVASREDFRIVHRSQRSRPTPLRLFVVGVMLAV
jgi:hypothetical protein